VAAWGFPGVEEAFQAWIDEPNLNDLILNEGAWSIFTWEAMGVGVDMEQHLYYLWFGAMPDPLGEAIPCASSAPDQLLDVEVVFPNPFNPPVTLSFTLYEEADVSLMMHDITGRRVRSFPTRTLGAGWHDLPWTGTGDNGEALPSGVYFVNLRVGDRTWGQRITLLR